MSADVHKQIQALKKQIEQTNSPKERVALLIKLGDELKNTAPNEGKKYLDEALRIAEEIGDLEAVGQGARILASIYRMLGDIDSSLKYAQQVLSVARQIGHRRLEGAGIYQLGMVYQLKGEYDQALEYYHQALEIWEENGNQHGVYAVLNQLGNLAGVQGKFEQAIGYYQRCGELFRQAEVDEFARATTYYNWGWVLLQAGRWEEATEKLYRTVAMTERWGYEHLRLTAISTLGELFLKRNRIEQAIEMFNRVVSAGREGKVLPDLLRDGLIALGEARFRQDEFASAGNVYEEASMLCKKADDKYGMCELYWRMAELELAKGHLNKCEGFCRQGLELTQKLGFKKCQAETIRVLALLEAERDQVAAAEKYFREALGLLADASECYEFARIQFQFARFLLRQGKEEEAVGRLKTAARVFRNLGIVAEAEEINRTLFRLELGTDRDMAVLSAISRLATLGLDPTRFLQQGLKILSEGFGYSGAALVIDHEARIVTGSINLEPKLLAEECDARSKVTESGICFQIVSGGKVLGRVFLSSGKKPPPDSNPLVLETVSALLAPAVQRLVTASAEIQIRQTTIPGFIFRGVIGRSPLMRKNFEIIARTASASVPVLIRGESGTGKELIARALHESSNRANEPFVAINCAAVPETLLEAEFFGVEKGAATGVVARKGKFELANGGTVFLDEIGDMSPGLQAKLLRVLQEREFERVGGSKTIKVDIRIVAATNQDIEKLIAEGKFRQDLYFRLNGVEITIPPLRERKEDIPELVRYFIVRANQEANRQVKGVQSEAMECLLAYDWPGNIRQLQNVIQRAVVLAEGDELKITDLPMELQRLADKIQGEKKQSLRATRRWAQAQAAAEVERTALIKCLEQAGGNVTKAAELAGYSRAQFYRLLKKHDISPRFKPKRL